MCEFHGSNRNGLEDLWWTDKFCYFSIIDGLYPITYITVINVVSVFIIL